MKNLAITLAAVLGMLLLPQLAEAGCTKDTDCKGDRICIEESCADPPAAGSRAAGAGAIVDVDLRFAKDRRGAAQRAIGGTWVLFGIGVASTGALAGWLPAGFADGFDDESIAPLSIFGGSALVYGISGPLASIGGGEARRGLERLGLEPIETGLRKPAFGLYGTSMGMMVGGFASIAVMVSADRDCDDQLFGEDQDSCIQQETTQQTVGIVAFSVFSLATATTSLISTALFLSDAIKQRRALIDAVDDVQAGRLSLRRVRPRILGAAPWFAPGDEGGGGLAVIGTF